MNSAEEFLRVFAPELTIDVNDDKTPVSNTEYWAAKLAEQSANYF